MAGFHPGIMGGLLPMGSTKSLDMGDVGFERGMDYYDPF